MEGLGEHIKQKVILDVDTGADDAVAILLAGYHPACQLVAVTVTHGNAPLSITLDNTLRAVEAGGLADIPIFPGARDPLFSLPVQTLPSQNEILRLPEASIKPQSTHAVQFLIDYYLDDQGPETIYMPIGPHTNLALALRIEPRLAKRIPAIITMGGAYLEGNVTPSAEFNIYADPEAAHIVFNAGIPIIMVGLEVTAQGDVRHEDIEAVRKLGTLQARVAAALMEKELKWFHDAYGSEGAQIFDTCAVAAAIDPKVLGVKAMWVDVELSGVLTRGRTVADISGFQKRKSNVDVGVHFDRKRYIQILLEGLG
jgi:ribosylpyrimidine nucleosidase